MTKKAIIMSVKPEVAKNLLEGKISTLVQKGTELYDAVLKLNKEQGSVSIYVHVCNSRDALVFDTPWSFSNRKAFDILKHGHGQVNENRNLNNKVVAKFVASVHKINGGSFNQFDAFGGCYQEDSSCPLYLEQSSGLTQQELHEILKAKPGTAVHIIGPTLDIFDKPQYLSWFRKVGFKKACEELYAELQAMAGYYTYSNELGKLKAKYAVKKMSRPFRYVEEE